MRRIRVAITTAILFTMAVMAAIVPLHARIDGPRPVAGEKDSAREGRDFALTVSGHGGALWWDAEWGRVSQIGDMQGSYTVFRWVKFERVSRRFPVEPCGIGGLSLSLALPRAWGLSAEARVGGMRTARTMNYAILNGAPDYTRFTVDALLVDGDLRAWYRVTPWFRAFAGPRYRGYRYGERQSGNFGAAHAQRTTFFHSLGAAAGGDFSVKLVADLYLEPSAALTVMYGLNTGSIFGETLRHSLGLGGDGSLFLAYRFPRYSTAVRVGFVYQGSYLVETLRADYLNRWDHRFGVTAGSSYTF